MPTLHSHHQFLISDLSVLYKKQVKRNLNSGCDCSVTYFLFCTFQTKLLFVQEHFRLKNKELMKLDFFSAKRGTTCQLGSGDELVVQRHVHS